MIIPKITFPIYWIIVILSGIVSIIYILLSLYKDNYKDKRILLFIILYIPFSFTFAKFYNIVSHSFREDFLTSGFSSYGGFIGAIISSFIFEKIFPLEKKLIKYTILSLPLTYGLSKIACFIVGCCYGIPYNGLFSVTYIDELNIPLFPIQFVEAIFFVFLFVFLNNKKYEENITYNAIIISSFFKFLLDFLRYDHLHVLLSFNQIISIIIIFIAFVLKYKQKMTL